MAAILIADDEVHIRLLLEDALEDLEDQGVELLMAENGQMALDMVRARRPKLVFLDVMMPLLHGFEVCLAIKEDPALAGVYVVILTGRSQESDFFRGQECGADLYLVKPFKTKEVKLLSRRVLGLPEGG
jgi:two-component system, OmpR family, alkaline phosphatase synthesis response regulator PhoP